MRRIQMGGVLVAALLLLPCAVATALPAGTVDIVHIGYGASDDALIWGAGHTGTLYYTGLYQLGKTGDTGSGALWPDGWVSGFCIELHEPAPKTTYTYQVAEVSDAYNSFLGTTLGADRADLLAELWGRYYDPLWAVGAGSATDAEAFSAAVWEIVNESVPVSPTEYDVTDWSDPVGFAASSLDITTANNWLHSLDGTGPKATLAAFTHQGQQDFLVQVPEPATICLLGLGAGLSLIRRKRTTA